MNKVINSVPGVIDCSIGSINGGYRSNSLAQWKEYKVTVEVEEGITLVFHLNCHAAGSMGDPFDAYDMTLTY